MINSCQINRSDLFTIENKNHFLLLPNATFLVEMLTAVGKVSACISFGKTLLFNDFYTWQGHYVPLPKEAVRASWA